MFVPTNSGIVIAADTRHTIAGRFCDGEAKLVVLSGSHLAVAAVTGQPTWYARPILGGKDTCELANENWREFDALRLVRDFLSEHPANIQYRDLYELRDRCVQGLNLYFSSHSKVAAAVGARDVFVVSLATFDPKSRVSTVCYFTVSVSFLGPQAIGSDVTTKTWALGDSEVPVATAGEKEYYEKYVENGEGKRFIVHRPKGTVSETDARYGKLEAIDVLRATSRMAAKIQPSSGGIGGPIDIAFVDGISEIRSERVPNFDRKTEALTGSNGAHLLRKK